MSQKLSKEYEDIWKLPAEKVEQFNTDFKYIKKVEKETRQYCLVFLC